MTGIAGPMARAGAEGAAQTTLIELVEAASEAGATRALNLIGLHDEAAGKDIVELRSLIQGWRDAKTSALRAVVAWTARGLVALLLFVLALKLRVLS